MAARNTFRTQCIAAVLLAATPTGAALAASGAPPSVVISLETAAVKYQMLQQRYHSALDELRRIQQLPELRARDNENRIKLAEIYLALGLSDQAGETLRELAAKEAVIPPALWLTLARQYYQRGYLVGAEAALSNLSELLPGPVQAERDYLLAVVLLARRRTLEVIPVSHTLKGQDAWGEFGRYNLGIALMESRRADEGLVELEKLARSPLQPDSVPGLRDEINTRLGYLYLNRKEFDKAAASLSRAGGTKALLGAGWADYLRGDYRTAAQGWARLSQGDSRDAAVQEGLLGLARAHYEAHQYPAATASYEKAIRTYLSERKNLEDAAKAIRDGSYLQSLLASAPEAPESAWHWRPGDMSPHPASPYLEGVTNTHAFQETLKNYRNLLYLDTRLHRLGDDIEAYLSLFRAQRAHYLRMLPKIDEFSRSLDRSGIFERGEVLKQELARAETGGDVTALASSKEKRQLVILQRFEQQLERNKEILIDHEELKDKFLLLRGLLYNDMSKVYTLRLWDAKKAFIELDKLMTATVRAQKLLHQASDRAKDNFGGQESTLKSLGAKQQTLLTQRAALLEQHRSYLETTLLHALNEHEDRLDRYLSQARLGLAQSLDQTQSQADAGNADYAAAIAAYRAYIQAEAESEGRDALMRLAHLELLQAENRYNKLVAKSEKDAVKPAALNEIYRDVIATLSLLLKRYPGQVDNDRVWYQLANVYYNTGETDLLLDSLDRLAHDFPASPYLDEVQFRRGELLFALGLSQQASQAYGAVVVRGPESPYYEKALYKHGWSQYKENQHAPALDSFLSLLDRKLSGESAEPKAEDTRISRGDEEIINDVLRVVSLSLAQLNGTTSLARYFDRVGPRDYEHRLYAGLAELYLAQQRIEDAANAYRAYIERHPADPRAPLFQAQVLNAYEKGGFTGPLLASKEEYVQHYQPGAAFWRQNPEMERDETLARVRTYLKDLAHYRHARAQNGKQAEDYQAAEKWYRQFLQAFPQDPEAADMNFLLAEALYEARQLDKAIQEYEHVAYDMPPHDKSAEAAYAAIVAREKLTLSLSGAEQDDMQVRTVAALLRFAQHFPADPRTLAAQIKAAQTLFNRNDLAGAEPIARQILALDPSAGREYRLNAWRIIAHSEFETLRYADAEKSYQEVLALSPAGDNGQRDVRERLAAAIYKQGELAAGTKDHRAAAQHFLRVGQLTPGVDIHATAEYDAAAQLLILEDWPAAITVLERFRKAYPAHPLQKDLSAKLAVAYQNNGDWAKAAGELEKLAGQSEDEEIKRDAIWQSAELYVRSERPQDAIRRFEHYLRIYPQPLADAIEAHRRIAELYAQAGDRKNQQQWLAKLVTAEQQGGPGRSDRTRFLAAQAALSLAHERYTAFEQIKLSRPLEKSLKLKKQAMEEALQAYRATADYAVAGVTTAATYYTARIYADFGSALLHSERPTGLNEIELEQYNVLLEEQAYPFEEQAIELYEANAHRSVEHIYDEWVQKSFAALSKLLPARYSKPEQGEHFIDALY